MTSLLGPAADSGADQGPYQARFSGASLHHDRWFVGDNAANQLAVGPGPQPVGHSQAPALPDLVHAHQFVHLVADLDDIHGPPGLVARTDDAQGPRFPGIAALFQAVGDLPAEGPLDISLHPQQILRKVPIIEEPEK